MKASHRKKALKNPAPSPRMTKALAKAQAQLKENALELSAKLAELKDKLLVTSLSSSVAAENMEENKDLLKDIQNAPFDALTVLTKADLSNAKSVQKALDELINPLQSRLQRAVRAQKQAIEEKAKAVML